MRGGPAEAAAAPPLPCHAAAAAAPGAALLLLGLVPVVPCQRSHVRLWGEGSVGVRRPCPGEASWRP